ncbi:MAG: class I SAM-dependent methyltransferase [Solirubrobacterales bacterium]
MSLEQASGNRLTRSTAEGAALLRAAGHLVREPGLRGPDHLAARFIAPGLNAAAAVKLPGARFTVPAVVEHLLPGGLWFEIARTRGVDDFVREEVADGAGQVVIVGAGLDSRAYRMPALAATTVYEVDHPITAAYKRERVAAVVGDPPDNVRYVEVDFAAEDLASAIAGAGHECGERSAIIWSGVAPYLEPGAVDATLAWVAAQATGTQVAFDYCWQELIDGEADEWPGARNLRRRVADQGEPLRSGILRGRTREFLAERGLELVEDVDAAEATRRYATRADGSAAGWIWEFGGFARARVP